MKKKVYIVVSVVVVFLIIAGIMLSMKMSKKNVQEKEIIGKVEEIQEESSIQALETEPQVPETWDLNKVYPVLSEDNIYVPVPIGWSISTSEDERYVNGNVTKKGTLSNLTFTSTGDYPWTQNSDNIWVSGNKGIANSTSELISNEIEVGENGGWVEIEWSACSQSGYDVLYMYVNDTVNGTTEQLPKEISGTLYGTSENSLIYTRCGTELAQGKYTISIKYTKDSSSDISLDSGYVKSGTFINYDENGTDELAIHKTGGFVIYEGDEPIDDLWTASKNRNQFVWVPVADTSRIYERDSTTGKIRTRLWNYEYTPRREITQSYSASKREPGILNYKSGNIYGEYDGLRLFNKDPYSRGLQGYTKDILYKELENEYQSTIKSIQRYGGFYLGRYETGAISSIEIPVVRRMNTDISNQNWYNMYTKMKNISTNSNIQTSMIWGSLWDETLEWLIESEEKIQKDLFSATWGNFYAGTFTYYNNDGELTQTKSDYAKLPTGSTKRNMANNIYDLAGNVNEWTLESGSTWRKYYRGGAFNTTGVSVNSRTVGDPCQSYNAVGFRAYLYIY